MFPLFESIKIRDGVPFNLSFHQERLDSSFFRFFGKQCVFSLKDILQLPENVSTGLVKCRFSYNENSYMLDFDHYVPRKIRSLKIVCVEGLDYSLKYTDRSIFESLLVQKEGNDDILIVDKGMISDTSFSNIVFTDGTQWITPETPLLKGTQRERLLREGKIGAARITPDDLKRFTFFRLINAMLDFEEQEDLSVSEGIRY